MEFILRIGIFCLHEGSLTVTTKTHLQIKPSSNAGWLLKTARDERKLSKLGSGNLFQENWQDHTNVSLRTLIWNQSVIPKSSHKIYFTTWSWCTGLTFPVMLHHPVRQCFSYNFLTYNWPSCDLPSGSSILRIQDPQSWKYKERQFFRISGS